MERRAFITLLGAVAVASPLAALAQSAGQVWRIGYLSSRYGPSELSESFLQELRELGYVEGKNLIAEHRDAAGKNERLPELTANLVFANVDLIATEGTPATEAAIQATKVIPIVFGSAQDPIEKTSRRGSSPASRTPVGTRWERDGNGADCQLRQAA